MASQDPQPLNLLVIGDPHFKEGNVEQTRSMIQAIVKVAQERRPDLIICLGDVLDRHAKIHVDPLCDAVSFFKSLVAIGPLVVIIGNHDRRNNSDFLSDRHPFTSMEPWYRTQVVDRVRTWSMKGHLLIFVPYVPPGRFIEALDSYDPNTSLEERERSLLAEEGPNILQEMNCPLSLATVMDPIPDEDIFLQQILGPEGWSRLVPIIN